MTVVNQIIKTTFFPKRPLHKLPAIKQQLLSDPGSDTYIMKTDKQLAEFIFDMFRSAKCRAGHIIMMRTFRTKVQSQLNPKEQDKVVDTANKLIDNGYMTYEDGSQGIECLRLTDKGYGYIYDSDLPLDGFDVSVQPAATNNTQTSQNETKEICVNLVRELEKTYAEAIKESDRANSSNAIEAFNNWYRALLILLHRNFPESNLDYKYIKEQNVSGNGSVKLGIYEGIQARAALLLDEIEFRKAKVNNEPKATSTGKILPTENNMNCKPIYKVFVSSTFKDLEEERLKVMTTIVSSGHLPIGMEQFPAAPIEAWDYIKLLIDNSDYYLLLLAGKYGTIHPGTGKSYTQMEYEYAVEKEVPIIFLTYYDIDSLPMAKCEADPDIREKLESFRKQASGKLRKTWKNIDDLAHQVQTSLERTIELCPRVGWVRADAVTKSKSERLDINLDETISISSAVNPFSEEQSDSKQISLKEFIISVGAVLKEYAQIHQIRAAASVLGDIDYNDLDIFLEKLLYSKVIERGQINNEYEGTYKVWSFTNEGLDLYLSLKMNR